MVRDYTNQVIRLPSLPMNDNSSKREDHMNIQEDVSESPSNSLDQYPILKKHKNRTRRQLHQSVKSLVSQFNG